MKRIKSVGHAICARPLINFNVYFCDLVISVILQEINSMRILNGELRRFRFLCDGFK